MQPTAFLNQDHVELAAMTRTSVSPVLIMIILLPSAAACFACVEICVSASSWLQGVSPSRLIDWLETTSSSCVTITVLFAHIATMLSARKLKSLVLLLLSLKKLCQVCGIFPLSVNLRLAPMPPFDRVSAFRLEDQ